jgi:hypothetical protein
MANFQVFAASDDLNDWPTYLTTAMGDLRQMRADGYGPSGSTPSTGLPSDPLAYELIVNTDETPYPLLFQRSGADNSWVPVCRLNDPCWGFLPRAGHPLTGQSLPMLTALNMGSKQITALAAGTADAHAVNKAQLDAVSDLVGAQQLYRHDWLLAYEGDNWNNRGSTLDRTKDNSFVFSLGSDEDPVQVPTHWYAVYQKTNSSPPGNGTVGWGWWLEHLHASNSITGTKGGLAGDNLATMTQYYAADGTETTAPKCCVEFTQNGNVLEVEIDVDHVPTQVSRTRLLFGFLSNAVVKTHAYGS